MNKKVTKYLSLDSYKKVTKYLSIDSSLYGRRMVREINKILKSGKSVYARSHPFNQRVRKAHSGFQGGYVIADCQDKIHRQYGVNDFYDEYGHQIVASREA